MSVPSRQNNGVHVINFVIPAPPPPLTAVIMGGFREELAIAVALKKGLDFTRQRRTEGQGGNARGERQSVRKYSCVWGDRLEL